MQQTIEVQEEEDCVPVIWRMLNGERIIRVDGHSAMGKSRIAKHFCGVFGWAHLQADDFLLSPRPPGLYHEKVDKPRYLRAARDALALEPGVVLDAICLDYLIAPHTLGPEFRVYMLSLTGPSMALDEARRNRNLGSAAYHEEVDPQSRAHLVVVKRVKEPD